MKRDIFAELTEGFTALADERNGKATLRSHKVRLSELAVISAEELVAIRERLNMSRPVFAMYLRTNARTLENWEQGRAKPCLLYTSPSPRDQRGSRMPSSA